VQCEQCSEGLLPRAIRHSPGGEYTVIVGIVRRHLLDREELLVVPHLNAGIDRWVRILLF
jgi:hypothetical protein